jgi:tetratricopeptide (TPR) repeat protein
MRRLIFSLSALALLALPSVPAALAENEGQADLDMATELQLSAETLGEMEQVIKLAESALDKGLDEGQTQFAKKLLAATLYQHANRAASSVFEQVPSNPRWPIIRQQALKDLVKAKEYDAKLPDIYILEAKFQALPGGDKDAGLKAINEGVKLLQAADDPKALAKALILRAQITDDEDKKLADFDAAVKADPENVQAWQGRAILYLAKGESEKAVADLTKLVEQDTDNPAVVAALAEALTNLKKYDEALKYAEEVIKLAPRSTLGHNLRARIYVMKDDLKAAIKDLDAALDIDDDDLAALLMRGRLHAAEGNDAAAKADVEKAIRLQPEQPQAILLRSMLAAQKEKFGEAIADIQMLLQTDPTNAEYRLQMATYMVGDNRPRKAIDTLTSVIEGISDTKDEAQKEIKQMALRARGDALLSVGKHAEAIEDYNEALPLDPEDTGVLNNLAWVLATSPEDGVRNADRSIELGLKACELTKYEKPHILSTLAAGYAEKGDWENAVKWSKKAVELGGSDMDVGDQLKKEVESYEAKKPWREKQEIEENTKPLVGRSNDLET